MTPGRIANAGLVLLALCVWGGKGAACSFCEGGAMLSPTFRQEAALSTARVILHGSIANPRLSADGKGGKTDFLIQTILRADPAVKGKKLVLERYLPIDKGETPDYLLFCDIDTGKIDPYRGVRIKGPTTVDYVKKALALSGKDPTSNLAFFFRYLDNDDPEVARDAFLEFAKATDATIAKAAPGLNAEKLRSWIKDPKTPTARLGVYSLLLGASGKEADALYLRSLLDSKEERYQVAADGLLAGYMQGKPKEGWTLAQDILADGRKSLPLRLCVLKALRFYQGSQPKESRPYLLKAMRTVLVQGELADLAVEDLRRWQMWDLSAEVLKLYGQKGFDAPLMKRAILRYALSCKNPKDVGEFLKQRRAAAPDLVKEVEESLEYEKVK